MVRLAIKKILQQHGTLIGASILLSVISGLCGMALIIIINSVLNEQPLALPVNASIVFIVALLILVASSFGSKTFMSKLFATIVYHLRMDIVAKILNSSMQQMDKLGTGRLLAALSSDVNAISLTFNAFPSFIFNSILCIGGFTYLAWLSLGYFVLTFSLILFTLCVVWFWMNKVKAKYETVRDGEDHLYSHYNASIFGAKELKLHTPKTDYFFSNVLEPTANILKKQSYSAGKLMSMIDSFGVAILYTIVGCILFVFGMFFSVERHILSGFTLTLLFLAQPIAELFNTLSVLTTGVVAVKKIERLQLGEEALLYDSYNADKKTDVEQIELNNIEFEYGHHNKADFNFGPVSISFKRGQVTFITGGNGSGKSTLSKLLLGLYTPTRGELLWDGKPVTEKNLVAYRNLFSSIFFDFHLFEFMFAANEHASLELVGPHLKKLGLDHVVLIEGNRVVTNNLSQGQKRRLALLISFLDDKPICLFDEWAADQDPEFRDYFYHEILPALSSQNKIVIVVSHDSQYFHTADRVLHMQDGRCYEKHAERHINTEQL